MAAREGFARTRTVLKVVGGLWLALALWSGISQLSKGGTITGGDVAVYVIGFGLPAGIVWGVFWVTEGFFVKRGDR
jgi:hypothetical protein